MYKYKIINVHNLYVPNSYCCCYFLGFPYPLLSTCWVHSWTWCHLMLVKIVHHVQHDIAWYSHGPSLTVPWMAPLWRLKKSTRPGRSWDDRCRCLSHEWLSTDFKKRGCSAFFKGSELMESTWSFCKRTAAPCIFIWFFVSNGGIFHHFRWPNPCGCDQSQVFITRRSLAHAPCWVATTLRSRGLRGFRCNHIGEDDPNSRAFLSWKVMGKSISWKDLHERTT